MRLSLLSRTLALAVLFALPRADAAEIVASGISVPFFDHAGKFTHRMLANSGTKSGSLQKLHGVTIQYFAPHDPETVVQKIEAEEATWDDQKETLVGRGSIVVATMMNRLTGEGFDFALATSRLNIHRSFTMANPEIVLTSDRATIDLIVDRGGENVKVRDVRRCEAKGNLHIVVQPTARKKYRFKEAFSDLAIYDGATQVVSLPNPIRTIQLDGGEGQFKTLTVNLRDEAKK